MHDQGIRELVLRKIAQISTVQLLLDTVLRHVRNHKVPAALLEAIEKIHDLTQGNLMLYRHIAIPVRIHMRMMIQRLQQLLNHIIDVHEMHDCTSVIDLYR